MRSYKKFRLYPSKVVETELNIQLELCQWTYNKLLEELNKAKDEGKKLKRYDTQKLLVKLKEDKPELKNVYSKTLQMVNQQLWNNIHTLAGRKRKGYKIGKLRFKSYDHFKSIFYNQSGFIIGNKKIILSKVGKVEAEFHREIKGNVKGIIISKRAGKWYACIQVENPHQEKNQIKVKPNTSEKAVGIDVGVTHFLADSNYRFVENPRFLQKTADKIALIQRQLARKKKGSNRRNKIKLRLNKAYEHLQNQRKDFAHKLSTEYVKNYGFIAVENLNIQGMARNHHLSKSIYDAAWSLFISYLSYKAESAGRILVKVNPKDTTQTCSVCEEKNIEHLDLSVKIFKCPYCKIEIDRDINAARNIIIKALFGREPASMLVENRPLLHKLKQVSSLKREAPCVSLE
ncbi:MAG: transposase [Candidatus Parvarchaeota archaeon]|nr:transposase [Candidatus Parvarchaeota archaeon]